MRRSRLGARSIRSNGINRRRKAAVIRAAVEGLESRTLLSTSVLTYHNDNASDGVNNTESLLTPSSVNVNQFRKQFAVTLDGQEYSQPLYYPGLNITTGSQPGVHNVAFVTTQHDSLYAIDTNGGSVLWHDSFISNAINPNPLNPVIPSGTTTVPNGDTGSSDINPEIGITATPVIDPATNMLYLTSTVKQVDASNFVHYIYTLYKINVQNGTIVSSNVIGDTIYSGGVYYYRTTGTATDLYVNGTGDGSITSQVAIDGRAAGSWGGTSRVYFNALRETDRPGVVLVTNPDSSKSIYLAFASHGDNGPYHGWLLPYDAASLTLTGVINTTPNGGLGGIWQGGGISALDASGSLYFETGNGSFNYNASNFLVANTNGINYSLPLDHDYGDCFVKVTTDTTHTSPTNQNSNGWGMQITDFFSPGNNSTLNGGDTDLGSGGPVILPDAVGSAAHPHLLIGAGKEGKIYLIDRDKMGGFSYNNGPDFDVQEQANNGSGGINGSLNTPGFFLNNPNPVAPAKPSGVLYYFPGYGGDGRAFTVSNGAFSTSYTSHTTDNSSFNSLDGTPSISSMGLTNGIVWVIDRGTNTLRAYDANNLATNLWNSNMAANSRDATGAVTKFSVPTVADGLVMIGTLSQFVVYGPPITPTSGPNAPSNLTAASPNFQTVNLAWQDNSNNEDQFNIERSPAGQNAWVQIAIASANATNYTDNTTQSQTAYDYRVRAFNSFNGGTYSGYTNVATVTTPVAPPTGTGDGALGDYYNDVNSVHLSGTPALVRVDPQINFNWGTGSPDPSIGVDHFSAKWTGMVQAQYSEVYTFYTESDDGVMLFVNGQQLINNFTDHSPTENVGTISLSGGQEYTFEMDYYEDTGGAEAQLLWSSPSTPKAFVPQSQLYSGVAPAAPSNLAGVPSSGSQINLTWSDNSNNETGFDLEREVVGNGTFQEVLYNGLPQPLPPNTTSYMDTGLTPGVTYAYEIRALNFGGNSAYVPNPPLQIMAPLPPNKPTNARATATSTNQISIAWQDNSNNEDGFRVLRESSSSGGFNQVALLPANTTTFTDTGTMNFPLVPGTEYEYHVQAFNVAGYLDFTGTDTATLTLAPTNLMASGGNGTAVLNWTAPNYDSFNSTQLTFNVYRGTSAGGESATPVATGLLNPTFSDTGLTNGTTYYYKVTAVEIGGESARSSETPITPTGVPVTPVISAVTIPTAVEGTALAATLVTFTGTAGDAFTATVDYGDGSPVVHPTVSDLSFSIPSYAYAEDGMYTITLTVTDTTGGLPSAPKTAPVTITPAPIQASIGGATPMLTVGGSANLTFSATNPNALEMGPLIESWTITNNTSNATVASGIGPSFTFTPTVAGQYTVSFTAGESSVPDAESNTATATISVLTAADPLLASLTVDDGNRQRSEVRSLTLSFSSPVTLGAGALTLDQWNTGGSGLNNNTAPTDASAALGTPTSSDGGMTWVVPILHSTAFSDSSGSLVDGIYTIVAHSGPVTDALGRTLDADQSATFHRLFGDVNGDRKVSNADFTFFSNAFGASFGQANYNRYFDFPGQSGKISNADFTQFSNRFGKSFNWITYSYVADQSSYTAAAGSQVAVKIYLKETLGTGNTSVITADNGLSSFGVSVNRSTSNLPASPSTISNLAADAVDFPDFSGAGYTTFTATGGKVEGAIDVAASSGVGLGNTGGGASPAVAGEVYLGTLTVTAGAAGGSTAFTLGAIDPVNGGWTVTKNNVFDLDVTQLSTPAYVGVWNQLTTFNVAAV